MPYPSLLHSEPLSLRQSTADPYLHRRCSNTVLSQSLWGPWGLVHTRFVWVLLAPLARMGFDSKREFTPPTVLLGLLLCPWTWGISSQLFQCLLSYWNFSDFGHVVSPQGWFSEAQPPLLTLDVASAESKYLSLVFLLSSLRSFCLFVYRTLCRKYPTEIPLCDL